VAERTGDRIAGSLEKRVKKEKHEH
jgi:hypothetical protein